MPEPDADTLRETAKAHLWPTFGKDPSFFDSPASIITQGRGSMVTDVDGGQYLDATSSAFASTLGFNHPVVVEAMIQEMSNLVQNPSGWPAPVSQVRLAEKLASLSPGTLQYTMFACNGTDANETAIKMARQYHKMMGNGSKFKVIGRSYNYHGMSLATLAAGAVTPRRKFFEPLPGGFYHINPPYSYRNRYGDDYEASAEGYANELRELIELEDPSTVACYIGEQTITARGVIPPPKGYMPKIREICDEYDVILIVDEVVTGIGRTGGWLECLEYDYVPDIVTMAKGITAGHAPLSATHVKEEIATTFFGSPDRYLQHGYTYGGMAVSCAAGLATMQFIEETGLFATVESRNAEITQRLRPLADNSPVIGDLRSHGMLFGLELVSDKETKEVWPGPDLAEIAKKVAAVGKELGVMLAAYEYEGKMVLVLAPPLNVTDGELDAMITALEAAVKAIEAEFA